MSSEKVTKKKKQQSLDKNIITISSTKNNIDNVDNVDNVDSEKIKKTGTSNNDDLDVEKQFSGLLETLGNLRGQITQIQNQVRTLEKNVKNARSIFRKSFSTYRMSSNIRIYVAFHCKEMTPV